MNEESNLQECLRALAEAGPRGASPAVQEQLLIHFRERRGRKRWVYVVGAATSAVAVVVLCLVLWHNRNSQPGASPVTVDQMSGFITLPYGQSGVPLEQPVIVRVDIPVSQLGAMGMPPRPQGAHEKVRADLLVGQDGVARAVRFVE